MKEKPQATMDDLRQTALNDIEHSINICMRKGSAPLIEWVNLLDSVESAKLFGITKESILSRIIRSFPLPMRSYATQIMLNKGNSHEEIAGLLAPED